MADEDDKKRTATAKENKFDPPGMGAKPSDVNSATPASSFGSHNPAYNKARSDWEAKWRADHAAAATEPQGPGGPPGNPPAAAAVPPIEPQRPQAEQAARSRPDLLAALLEARAQRGAGSAERSREPANDLARMLLGPKENQKADMPEQAPRDDLAKQLLGERRVLEPAGGAAAGKIPLRDKGGNVMDDS